MDGTVGRLIATHYGDARQGIIGCAVGQRTRTVGDGKGFAEHRVGGSGTEPWRTLTGNSGQARYIKGTLPANLIPGGNGRGIRHG